MEHIKKRCIIFVYDNDDRLACLLFCRNNQVLESVSRSFTFRILSPDTFIFGKFVIEFGLQIFEIAILECGHIEVQDRVFCPVLFQTFDGKPLEQVFLASEIGMEGCAQQGFSEPTGTTEKYILVLLGQLVYQVCFIHVHASSIDDIAECLYSHRINSFCHSLCIFILCGKVTKSF